MRFWAAWVLLIGGCAPSRVAAPAPAPPAPPRATVVMVADAEAQMRVQDQLSSSALAGAPAAEVEVVLLRTSAGAWDTRVAGRGLTTRRLARGAGVTALAPSA